MLVAETINSLVQRTAMRRKIDPKDIYKMAVVGNSTMIHIFLGLPPEQIRLTPYITTVNHPPQVTLMSMPAESAASLTSAQCCTSTVL